MITILVTGGAGFIGSNLARSLLKSGSYEITVLDNFSTGYEENLSPFKSRIKIARDDVRDPGVVYNLTKNIDIIFHLAAQVGNIKSLESPRSDTEINVVGSINIIEAARKNGVKKIIYSASAASIGEPKYLPIDETHPINPDSPYGVSKFAAERYFLCLGGIYNISVVCLRYFNVYGINQRYDAYGNVIPIFVDRIIDGKGIDVYGDGEQTRDFVNVEDVVSANILSMHTTISDDVFNIATGEVTSINELILVLKKLFNKDIDVKYLLPRKGEVKHSYANILKARQLLKYNPSIKLYDGLKGFIQWYTSFKAEKEQT